MAERNLREALSVRATEVLGSATRLDTRAGRIIIHYGNNLGVLEGVLERLGVNEEDW